VTLSGRFQCDNSPIKSCWIGITQEIESGCQFTQLKVFRKSEFSRVGGVSLGYSDRGPDKWDITVPVLSLCVTTFKYLEMAIYKENSVLKKNPCVDSWVYLNRVILLATLPLRFVGGWRNVVCTPSLCSWDHSLLWLIPPRPRSAEGSAWWPGSLPVAWMGQQKGMHGCRM